ncbi:hypothetical protein GL50803_0023004 [Giardia duodenalis]|uniref:Uncharacterized protein n=2 Tax=Giardia intestinalis TaxID=5741 RepID=A8BGN4_GIAIC|nr:hypothetical protein GL50803_0023004 [Giardia intestinalis]KAE8302146.1 hypothetical protein GL50803_0023004 [Giardia intestinalis]|eukprot:XP_001707220.1 Hypothetical protein GL50803_23004 [Giardia lamblia ATCC 50803]
MPPAKAGSKLSAEVQKKIEAIRKQKKALPKGMEPVPKEHVAISDQISILTSAGFVPLSMDAVRIYQGDKVTEITKLQFMGNPRDNIWSISGTETEKAISDVPDNDSYVEMFRKYMSQMSKEFAANDKAKSDTANKEPEAEAATENQAAADTAPKPEQEEKVEE